MLADIEHSHCSPAVLDSKSTIQDTLRVGAYEQDIDRTMPEYEQQRVTITPEDKNEE